MDDDSEFAFMDSRRLGRIKMIDAEDITSVPPLSLLGEYVAGDVESELTVLQGDDPYLAMPSIELVTAKLGAKSAPIKAAMLDQVSFTCSARRIVLKSLCQNGIFCGIGSVYLWLILI